MPLSGKGMLVTMMDVDPAEELDFNDWYDKEHLAERVEIEGFSEARRYIAHDAEPKYLNLYTTLTFDVLTSPQYAHALQNQTERSLHHIERFQNDSRAIAHITASHGQGRGSVVFFAAIRPGQENRDTLRSALSDTLAALVSENDIISTHLLESDPELSKPLTVDTPPPNAHNWYVVIDATSLDSVTKQGENFLNQLKQIPEATLVYSGTYRLMWDLAKNEL